MKQASRKTPEKISLGRRMLARREELDRLQGGYTPLRVAEKLGVAEISYRKYEQGYTSIPSTEVRRLCEILKMTPNRLFGVGEEAVLDMDVAAAWETVPSFLRPVGLAVLRSMGQMIEIIDRDGGEEYAIAGTTLRVLQDRLK